MGEAGGSGTLRQRLGAMAVSGLSRLVARLPVGALHRVAWLAGAGWYLAAGAQRDLARDNLRRVCRWLDEHGTASPRIRAAARDPRALERLLRDAFGHRARYYLEVLMATRYDRAFLARHFTLLGGAEAEEWITRPGALILVGLHLGALELPSRYVTSVDRRVLAPMETLPNPPLQRYLERSRSHSGIELIPSRGAKPILESALRDGACIGLIADRDVNGPGVPVELFGATARIPVGPALLALESRAPTFVGAAIRVGWDRYDGRVIPVALPTQGAFRERVQEFLDEVARGFEQLVADAPEQWWSMFLPIWDREATA